ncbi:MAG: GAK system XXXCH domain-containing protein [Desulfohalobiaceae bacterium]
MQFTPLKHEMETVFTSIQESSATGEMPDLKHIDQFIRLCRQMHSQAEEAWEGESEDFLHLALQLQKAVKNSDIPGAILLIESLDDARLFCHQNFAS